jgi:hypothetical protein
MKFDAGMKRYVTVCNDSLTNVTVCVVLQLLYFVRDPSKLVTVSQIDLMVHVGVLHGDTTESLLKLMSGKRYKYVTRVVLLALAVLQMCHAGACWRILELCGTSGSLSLNPKPYPNPKPKPKPKPNG